MAADRRRWGFSDKANPCKPLKKLEAAAVRTKSTANRDLALLKHLFNMAISWGFLDKSPCYGLRLYREEQKVMRVLDAEEEIALLSACSDHLRPIVVMALATAMRRGEILNLQWQDVDLRGRVITVTRAKSGKIRHIPLNAYVYAVLREIPGPQSGHVFRWQGNPIASVTRSFQTALKCSGIRKVRFHDLRHTAISRMVLAGADLVTVKEIAGHSDISMTVRYSHPTPESKKRAVDLLLATDKSGPILAHGKKVVKAGSSQVIEINGARGRN